MELNLKSSRSIIRRLLFMKIKPLFLLMLMPLLASCNASQEGSHNYKTFTDMTGRNVTVDLNHIDRVLCLGAGALRYYSYVGDLSKLVGIEEIDTESTFGVGQAIRPYYTANKALFDSLPKVSKGGPQGQSLLNYETIATSRPNIIISFYTSGNDDIQTKTGAPVIALKQGQFSIFNETTIASLELLGEIFSRQSRVNELKNYINSVKNDFASLDMSVEDYYVGNIGNWGQTALTGTFSKFPVFEMAKVHNSLENMENPPSSISQTTIDVEQLVALDPDKLFVDAAGLDKFKTDYQLNKDKYSALTSIKNNEVYVLLPFNAYFTNLEVQVMSTYYVASIAHPTEFEGVNLEDKYDEILKMFVGKECYSDIVENPNSMGGYHKVNSIEELL